MRVLLLLIPLLSLAQCAKIGVFPSSISNSQLLFMIRIAETLTDHGHEVVIVRPNYNPNCTKLRSSNSKIREIRLDEFRPVELMENYTMSSQRGIYQDSNILMSPGVRSSYSEIFDVVCQTIVDNDEFIEKIRAEKFDLAIISHVDFCQLGIAHHVGISKWISTMSGAPHRQIIHDAGLPAFTSIFPSIFLNATNEMSFQERVLSFVYSFIIDKPVFQKCDNSHTEILRKRFGNDFPHISELRTTSKLTLVNADPLIEYPFPHTQKLQFIGGFSIKQTKKLEEPFASFVKKAKKVVVVALGTTTVTELMPITWTASFINVFRKNPDISFVWKTDLNISVPSNVLKSSWIPQSDVLAQSNVVGFITHGGYNSLMETVYAGVPAIFIPLMADQDRNSLLAQKRGFGIQISKRDMTTSTVLENQLNHIISDNKYKQQVLKYRQIIRNRPLKPDVNLCYWIDFVLENDVDLSIPQLNLIQLYNIDIVVSMVFFVVLAVIVIVKLAKLYYWSCFTMAYTEKQKEKLQ